MTGLLSRPWQPILEVGLTELIGVDEKVDQNDFSGSVSVDLPGKNPVSGEFLSWMLVSTGGDELAIDGNLLIFDADPSVDPGDTDLTVAVWKTLVGQVPIVASAFLTDGTPTGQAWYSSSVTLPFHALKTLYFVLKLTSATSVNSAAGDNELIQFNAWWRRES